MTTQFWAGERSRKITKRIVVEGKLILLTPAHFGSGDSEDNLDMPLLVDGYDSKCPLLPGASLAGALRNYLRDMQAEQAGATAISELLFGGCKGDPKGTQSPLIVDDAIGKPSVATIREGVKINPKTRTAEEKKLFNVQLWQSGVCFPLRFELLVYEDMQKKEVALLQAISTALYGLSNGSITLGARKRRGYGQIESSEWRTHTYILTERSGLIDWLENSHLPLTGPTFDAAHKALGIESLLEDKRAVFLINADFALHSSMLIRSGSGKDDQGPDFVHLHAVQANGQRKPVLSGTSLAGALRARALRIANTIAYPELHRLEKMHTRGKSLVDRLFGLFGEDIPEGDAFASKITVHESVIENAAVDWVQNRVSLNRFTGGALGAALFDEQPAFASEQTQLHVQLQVKDPKPYEIGLLLLLLKDLWTGDLPLGGESSVGRGRLDGLSAAVQWQNPPAVTRSWQLKAQEQGLQISGDNLDDLEHCVGALNTYLQGGRA